jgi:hypothetical protein
MAKKKSLPPRRKRMDRKRRLASAPTWLPQEGGKKLVHRYARWYGVDLECAVKELRLLGVTLDPLYVGRLTEELERRKERRASLARAGAKAQWPFGDSDERFAYIVGWTSGGAAYGLTWEEWEACRRGDDDAASAL